MDRLAVERENDIRQGAAADAHQRAPKSDHKAINRHRRPARQLGRQIPAIASKQKLAADEYGDHDEGDLEYGRRREGRDDGSTYNSEHRGHRPHPYHAWNHQTLFSMRQI